MVIRFGKRFWIITTSIIIVFTVFVVGRNLLHTVKIRHEIGQLEREKVHYEQRIEQDSLLLERLRYDDYLEEFARERYRMQRRGEQVYIIEEE